jgi:hypothetical protein
MKKPSNVTRTREERKVYKMERQAKARRRDALDRVVMQEMHDAMPVVHKDVKG